MLDFCPFDFNKIDMNNLAYELVFTDEWTWERVKNETVIGEEPKPFINENDDRRNTHYKDREDKKLVEVQLLCFWKTGIQEEKPDFSSCWN